MDSMSKRNATGIETRRRGGKTTYRATVYDRVAGRKISRTFDTISAAKSWRQDAYAALRAGDLSAERGPTLREAAEQWLAGARGGHVRTRSGDRYKPSAIRSYEDNLERRVYPDLGNARLGELRHADLQALVDRLAEQGHAPSTIQTSVTPLRAIYRRALIRGLVATNPTRGLEVPAVRSKPRQFCSPEEAEQLLAALAPEDRPLWACAFYSGLRRGELTALRWDDVDLATGLIRVRRGWDQHAGEVEPKSRHGRRNVPIPAALRDYLLEHKLRGGEGRVFGTAHDVRSVAERAVRTTWPNAELRAITMHEARHTYASFMIAAGVNTKALSTYMGHGSIGVTLDLYGHLMPGAEDEAAALLDAYLAREAGSTSPRTSPQAAGTAL
jgi:integrase